MNIQKDEINFLTSKGLDSYKAHQSVYFEKGSYIVKVAESKEELIKTFRLRYSVYGKFYSKPPPIDLDIDVYDPKADHIIVINKDLNEIVGTYRVLCSNFTKDFYTAREFNMDSVLNMNKRLVEMGRATVSEKARSGVVIALLWRGLGEYIAKIKADYLFGCATLWTRDFDSVAAIWQAFEGRELYFEREVFPLVENRIPGWERILEKAKELNLSEEDIKEELRKLPPLFKSYIKAGAKFGRIPANDPKLQSVDFFTICKVSELSKNLIKKYL